MQKILFASIALASVALAQTPVLMPLHTSTYNGYSRGWSVTAGNAFTVVSLDLPLDAQQAGDEAGFMLTVNGAVAFSSGGNTTLPISCCVAVNIGDVLSVVGNWSPVVPGTFTAHNSYSSGQGGVYSTPIEGLAHTFFRAGHQNDVSNPAYTGTAGFTGLTGSIGRILIETLPGNAGCATQENYGVGCNSAFNSFREFFSPASGVDLNGQAFTVIQTATGTVTVPSAATPRGTGTATNLLLLDDQELSVPFAVGALTMPIPGGTTAGLWVDSNGRVSAGANGSDFSPSIAEFLSEVNTHWALIHTDLRPLSGAGSLGDVWAEETATHFYVIYDNVDSWGNPGSGNTAEIHFDKASGNADYVFVNLAGVGTDYLVGYAPGGPSTDSGDSDLSALVSITTSSPEIVPLTMNADAPPVLGTAVTMTMDNIPAGSPVAGFLYGLTLYPAGLDLTGSGMPGCFQYVSLDSVPLVIAPATSETNVFNIPNDPGLVGLPVGVQGAAYSLGANALNAIASNGTRLTVGN